MDTGTSDFVNPNQIYLTAAENVTIDLKYMKHSIHCWNNERSDDTDNYTIPSASERLCSNYETEVNCAAL